MEAALRKAWAEHIGLDPHDERVEHGWAKDFEQFEAGWNAAILRNKKESRIPGTKFTVIIRDDAPLIHCGDTPSYRRVTLDLTQEQQEQIRVYPTSTSGGTQLFEAVSKVFIED